MSISRILQNLEELLSITYFRTEFRNINKTKIHPNFIRLYHSLRWSEFSQPNYDNGMIILITNVLNKHGFVLMARDEILELDCKKEPFLQVVLQYHLNNFIFYTKSTLDSVAIILNEVYQIGRSGGKIDLKHDTFYNDLILINSKSLVATQIKAKRKWIKELVNWRDEINHRTFSVIGQRGNAQAINDYCYRIAQEPYNLLDFNNYLSLTQKYGEDKFTQNLSTFCEGWVNNCRDLVETLGEELVKNISIFKK